MSVHCEWADARAEPGAIYGPGTDPGDGQTVDDYAVVVGGGGGGCAVLEGSLEDLEKWAVALVEDIRKARAGDLSGVHD